jgi:hypothetical protein
MTDSSFTTLWRRDWKRPSPRRDDIMSSVRPSSCIFAVMDRFTKFGSRTREEVLETAAAVVSVISTRTSRLMMFMPFVM